MIELSKSFALLLLMLNPFLVIIYLIDIVEKLEKKQFTNVLLRGGIIASVVFCLFAILGDIVFADFMNVEFASFQIFGGIVFFIIGIQFVFRDPRGIELLRGESEHIAGAIAMPILIGPGTISVSVIVGKRHEPLIACLVLLAAVIVFIAVILLLKGLHDYVKPQNESIIERYIEIAGRITALYIGTVSIDMIIKGILSWIEKA